MNEKLLHSVEASSIKDEVPFFEVGDTVKVHCRILEGSKERIQIFEGLVIAKSGAGTREMFTVRRVVQGQGVERKFPIQSPRIAEIEVIRSGVTKRAKLYYLRDRVGKATRLSQRRPDPEKRDAQAAKEAAKRAAIKAAGPAVEEAVTEGA